MHYYSLGAVFWFSAATLPIPAMSLLRLLLALHTPPRLILLHNSVPSYTIKNSVEDVCYIDITF